MISFDITLKNVVVHRRLTSDKDLKSDKFEYHRIRSRNVNMRYVTDIIV